MPSGLLQMQKNRLLCHPRGAICENQRDILMRYIMDVEHEIRQIKQQIDKINKRIESLENKKKKQSNVPIAPAVSGIRC